MAGRVHLVSGLTSADAHRYCGMSAAAKLVGWKSCAQLKDQCSHDPSRMSFGGWSFSCEVSGSTKGVSRWAPAQNQNVSDGPDLRLR